MTVTGLLAPIDALRIAALRPWGPTLRPLILSRERRVALSGALGVTIAFAVACGAPLWGLALGPVLLGVPHVLADLRYLVVRPGLHRRGLLLVLAGIPLALAALEPQIEIGLLAAAGAVLAARASWTRKTVLLALVAISIIAAWKHGFIAQLVLLHAHNLIALGLWWFWRKRTASAWVIPALSILGTAAIFLGAAEPMLSLTGGWSAPATGKGFTEHVEAYAPLGTPMLGLRLLLAFVFLQAVHYLVWLRLVPEDDRSRPAPRSFTASWNALRDDFGIIALAVVAAVALVIAVWGAVDLSAARDGYLRLVGFHAYLELAVAALWLAEGRR